MEVCFVLDGAELVQICMQHIKMLLETGGGQAYRVHSDPKIPLCGALQNDETDTREGYEPTCKVQFEPKHPL